MMSKFLSIIFIFLASVVFADDTFYSYGIKSGNYGVTTVTILPNGKTSFAKVIIEDNITLGGFPKIIYLKYKDVPIEVVPNEGGGDLPDVFKVLVPDDYYTDPENIIIKDGNMGVIYIFQKASS